MSFHSSAFPAHLGTGPATATTGLNEFSHVAAENLSSDNTAFFGKPSGRSPGHSITAKVEKACHAFSPFGGSWDYSEVD
jgi:hypothetical protein